MRIGTSQYIECRAASPISCSSPSTGRGRGRKQAVTGNVGRAQMPDMTRSDHQPSDSHLCFSAVLIQGTVNKEKVIPLVPAHTIKDVFTPEMKQEVIEKVAQTMVSIEGENVHGVTWVTINEVKSGDWAVGGQALKADYGHTLAAG